MRLTKMCTLGMLVALMAMLTLVPIAAAGDIEGKVQSVDPRTGAVTLSDGTKLKVMDAAKLQELKPGKSVKATFQEQGGEKVATSIQIMKSDPAPASPGAAPKY
jgi:Cu/Ag efflux protein CusF